MGNTAHDKLNVTIAIILHGDPPNIKRTIDSIKEQGYSLGDLSVLCLDDGTSPSARLFLDKQGVWVVDIPLCSSISVAKNVALALSPFEYVFFLDDHMYLEPNSLTPAMEVFCEHPNLAGVCGYYRSAKFSDWNLLRDIKRHSIYGKSDDFRIISLENFTTFSTGIGIVRRSVFKDLDFPENVFPPDFGGEDVPALVTALNNGHLFAFVPELASLHEHNLSFGSFLGKIEIEVRGRFSLFYWAISQPDLTIPYLHGFLNVPVFLYVTFFVAILGACFGELWLITIPTFLFLVECVLSLRCMNAPSYYSFTKKLLATLYVLTSDLLTPLCWFQYTFSSYKRPYSDVGFSGAVAMLRLFLKWELMKFSCLSLVSTFRRKNNCVMVKKKEASLL